MRIKMVMIFGSLLAGLLLFGSENEDNQGLADLSLEELMDIEIITATKVGTKASRVPVTVRTITSEQIKQKGFRDLKDIFRTLPGFDVSHDVQGEVRTLVVARGILGNQKLKILLNGRTYSPDTGERFVYGHNIPLSLIDRIEIVYGSASALYGADAFSGVINLITKKGASLDGVQVNLGHVDTGAEVMDVAYGKVFNNGLDLVLQFRRYEGEDFALHESYADYGIVSSYTGSLGQRDNRYPIDNWNAFLSLSWGDWEAGFDWQHTLETNAPSTIPTNYAYVADNVWGQDLGHAFVKHNAVLSEKWTVETSLSARRYEVDPESNFFIIQDTALSLGLPSYKYAYSESLALESQVTWTGKQTNMVLGVLYNDIISFPKTQNLAAPFDPSGPSEDDLSAFVDPNGYTFGLLGLEEALFGRRDYNNKGIFGEVQHSTLNGLHLTLGARFDTNSIYGDTFNPRLGLVYEWGNGYSFRSSYATAYIQPSNYYRWENWANPFAMHIPNLDIQPETVTTYGAGLSLMRGNLSFRVDAYYNDLEDVIRPIPAPAQAGNYPYYNPLRTIIGETTDSGFVEINANLGKIKTWGGEAELIIKQGHLVGTVSYALVDGDDNGFDIAKTSHHKFLVGATWHHARWHLAGDVRHFSKINTTAFNSAYGLGADETFAFSGDTVVHSNISYDITSKVRLNLAADNLLDQAYYGAAPYGESVWIEPRAPQAGRKLWLNLEVVF